MKKPDDEWGFVCHRSSLLKSDCRPWPPLWLTRLRRIVTFIATAGASALRHPSAHQEGESR